MEESRSFTIRLHNEDNYKFTVDFGDPRFAELVLDEPSPLGDDAGPNAARILAAAVTNCLTASLLFCMKKARIEPRTLEATAETTLGRNERGRFRVQKIDVRIQPTLEPEAADRLGRCQALFEEFCIVSDSVRSGIDIQVSVAPVHAEEDTLQTRA